MFYRLFYPRQTCMLATSFEDKPNVTIVDWLTPVSAKPPMIAVALNLKSYSLELLSSSRCFSVSILPQSMAEKAVGVGSSTGRLIDKIGEYQIKLKPAKAIKAPVIEGAIACVECQVQGILNAGDHALVVGEVVQTHFPDEEASKQPVLFNWGSKNYFGIKREQKEENGTALKEEKTKEAKKDK